MDALSSHENGGRASEATRRHGRRQHFSAVSARLDCVRWSDHVRRGIAPVIKNTCHQGAPARLADSCWWRGRRLSPSLFVLRLCGERSGHSLSGIRMILFPGSAPVAECIEPLLHGVFLADQIETTFGP
jgi:hypothetical protein